MSLRHYSSCTFANTAVVVLFNPYYFPTTILPLVLVVLLVLLVLLLILVAAVTWSVLVVTSVSSVSSSGGDKCQ